MRLVLFFVICAIVFFGTALGYCAARADSPCCHTPTPKTGAIVAQPGWFKYQLDWFQGPHTQIAVALEVSTDGGATYKLVTKENLRYQVSP